MKSGAPEAVWTYSPSQNQSWCTPREWSARAVEERDRFRLLRHRDVEQLEPGRLQALFLGLVGHRHQVAAGLERVGAHVRLRQIGLHHHLGLARIGDVDGGEVLRRALVREPEDAPAVGRDLDRHAFAHAAEAVERVLADELEIPGDGLVRALGGGLVGNGHAAPWNAPWAEMPGSAGLTAFRPPVKRPGSGLRDWRRPSFATSRLRCANEIGATRRPAIRSSRPSRYALALAQRSGRSAFFQSGMAEIFFSRSSTSASFCSCSRPDGKPGLDLDARERLGEGVARHAVALRGEERIDHVRHLVRVVLEVVARPPAST